MYMTIFFQISYILFKLHCSGGGSWPPWSSGLVPVVKPSPSHPLSLISNLTSVGVKQNVNGIKQEH